MKGNTIPKVDVIDVFATDDRITAFNLKVKIYAEYKSKAAGLIYRQPDFY